MSEVDHEMLALLREIRDLQQRHFDRYVEFTSKVLEGQRRAEEIQKQDAERAAEDSLTALEEQRRIGDIARRANLLTPVITLLVAGTLFSSAFYFVWSIFLR